MEWIRVEDRLPELQHEALNHSEDVLIVVKDMDWYGEETVRRHVAVGCLFYTSTGQRVWLDEDWSLIEERATYVTHWGPFPELPEE